MLRAIAMDASGEEGSLTGEDLPPLGLLWQPPAEMPSAPWQQQQHLQQQLSQTNSSSTTRNVILPVTETQPGPGSQQQVMPRTSPSGPATNTAAVQQQQPSPQPPAPEQQATSLVHWWSRRWAVAGVLAAMALTALSIAFSSSWQGRSRLQAFTGGVVLMTVSLLWPRLGPAGISIAEAPGGVAQVPSEAGLQAESEAIRLLREENLRLRSLWQGGPPALAAPPAGVPALPAPAGAGAVPQPAVPPGVGESPLDASRNFGSGVATGGPISGTVAMPRVQELKDTLNRIASQSSAPQGSGAFFAAPAPTGSLAGSAGTDSSWHGSLPPDFKRAGLDIYKNIRAGGSATIRDWLSHNFTGDKSGAVWIDLWTLATQLDYSIARAAPSGDAAVLRLLNTDDNTELALRRLSSYIYVSRTGDHAGGNVILGNIAPGTKTDIAPSWLVHEATAHSKMEHQRTERVAAATRSQNPSGGGLTWKKKSKGGGKGRGDGKQGAPPVPPK